MQITRNDRDTTPGPSDWFTGAVYFDTIATPSDGSWLGAINVHFTPGARTAWHTHPHGQTIYVTEGVGLCQARGRPIEVIHPGDVVFFEPGEDHWHGATPNRFMAHIAMQEADDSGTPVYWGEHVTDAEYGAAPASSSTARLIVQGELQAGIQIGAFGLWFVALAALWRKRVFDRLFSLPPRDS